MFGLKLLKTKKIHGSQVLEKGAPLIVKEKATTKTSIHMLNQLVS